MWFQPISIKNYIPTKNYYKYFQVQIIYTEIVYMETIYTKTIYIETDWKNL